MNFYSVRSFLNKFSKSGIFFWSLALPPRYQDINWSELDHFKQQNPSFQDRSIKKSYSLSQKNIGHSARAYMEGGRIAVPNVGGYVEYFDTSKRKPQSNPRTTPNENHRELFSNVDKKVFYHERGKYELSIGEGEVHYFAKRSDRDNVWKLPLNQSIISAEQRENSSSIWMSSYKNPKLMYLSWGEGREYKKSILHRVEWKKDSLPLFLDYCAKREVHLIDKDDNGEFMLYNFFERGLNGPFPKFQVSLNEALPKKVGSQNPEIYQALTVSCNKVYLIGNFGITGIEF